MEEPSLLGYFVALLVMLVFIDLLTWGRIGGFRNLFAERAERIARMVWDENPMSSKSPNQPV